MDNLLLPQRTGEHQLYSRLRDCSDPDSAQRREYFCEWWRQYSQYAPKSFPKKLQIEFHQRWWEMYLTVGMINVDLSPTCPKSDSGPDISLDVSGKHIFVEATVPTPGTKSDRVPNMCTQNATTRFPQQQCLLRLTQAFSDKYVKIKDYIHRGVIPKNACTIIAISASDLNGFGTLLDGFGHPAPLSFLAGAGCPVVTIDGSCPTYSSRRATLQRDSGSRVDAIFFDNPDCSIISGVLYSPVELWNAPLQPEKTLSLFVNPLAQQPLPAAFCHRFVHWVQEMSSLEKSVWRKFQPY